MGKDYACIFPCSPFCLSFMNTGECKEGSSLHLPMAESFCCWHPYNNKLGIKLQKKRDFQGPAWKGIGHLMQQG